MSDTTGLTASEQFLVVEGDHMAALRRREALPRVADLEDRRRFHPGRSRPRPDLGVHCAVLIRVHSRS